jgi:hypothetical protein
MNKYLNLNKDVKRIVGKYNLPTFDIIDETKYDCSCDLGFHYYRGFFMDEPVYEDGIKSVSELLNNIKTFEHCFNKETLLVRS